MCWHIPAIAGGGARDRQSPAFYPQVARDGEADVIPDEMLTKEMEEAIRSVRYHFDSEFLGFKTVRTS